MDFWVRGRRAARVEREGRGVLDGIECLDMDMTWMKEWLENIWV